MIQIMKKLFREAHEVINKEEEVKEGLKIGTLRGGSAGAIVDDKQYASNCGRLAQARLLGYQSSPTEEMRLMFNGGFTLETYFEQRLLKAGIDFVKEEEHAVTIEGMTISMRPDFDILIPIDGIRTRIGVEIKSLASPFSVIKQRKNDFPFMKHMLQAATYMSLLQRDKWLIAIGHSFFVNQNGKKHEPELKWYTLEDKKGKFVISNESGISRELPFDKSHIVAYYKEVQSKSANKVLMERPTELELNVDTYDRCKYCPMASACNEYEANQIDFKQWLERVKITKESE